MNYLNTVNFYWLLFAIKFGFILVMHRNFFRQQWFVALEHWTIWTNWKYCLQWRTTQQKLQIDLPGLTQPTFRFSQYDLSVTTWHRWYIAFNKIVLYLSRFPPHFRLFQWPFLVTHSPTFEASQPCPSKLLRHLFLFCAVLLSSMDSTKAYSSSEPPPAMQLAKHQTGQAQIQD